CNGAETCDPANGCQPGAPLNCDDDDVCNGTESCDPVNGCQPGTPLDCDDGDVCNGSESCDPVNGCQPGTPLDCDDGDVCNGAESCDPVNGCQPGTPLECDDGNPCTDDSCDPASGCVFTPNNNPCDDGDPTTCNDLCIAGECSGGPCCGDGICDPSAGEDCSTCPSDCPPVCGDGTCECGEDCKTCPADCTSCPSDFEYACVIVSTPSDTDQTTTLPSSPTAVGMGDAFFVEFWATDAGSTNTGVTCAYVDLDYPEDLVTCVPPPVATPLFPLFPSGACDGSMVDELGGCQLTGGVGVEPEWARVGHVEFTCDAMGSAEFMLAPAASESSAHNRGLVLPSDIDYGICSVECLGCPCIYDLDNNCLVAGGDLGLFAGCWLCGNADPCWEVNNCEEKDFDCNGSVAGGDLGWFAGAWLKSCDELDPMVDFPPCRQCDGPIVCPWPGGGGPPPPAMEGPVSLALRLTQAPTAVTVSAEIDSLAIRDLEGGEHVFAEVWVRDGSGVGEGVTAVFADVFFDPSEFQVVEVSAGETFTMFSNPTIDGENGVVRRVGGATVEPNHGIGTWNLVSTVELQALTDVKAPRVRIQLSGDEAISLRGYGLVPHENVRILQP
ncbi:MAG: hypothetical protein IID41_15590, partial [Planctomycetes bacterium]|nr:hypothetical protein [Planctomycetota bacterium]